MHAPRPGRAPLLAIGLAGALAAAPALAQRRGGEPALPELALLWASGLYKGPVVCQLPEGPRRVARTVRIHPPKRSSHRPMHVVEVQSLAVDGARCLNELGAEEPDVEGTLRIALFGHHRPDTASKDFQQALRRKGGFRFAVPSGRLRVRRADGGASEVELAGGTAELARVAPGSDAARILGDVGDLPKRTLTLEAKDGTRLVFHLVLLPAR